MATAEKESAKDKPTIFVIFGATGDLSRKKLFPSLFELFKNNLLPDKLKIVASARSDFTSDTFTKSLLETIKVEDQNAWNNFAKIIEYLPSDVAENKNLDLLRQKAIDFEKASGSCVQRIFYMAISPFIFEQAVKNLGETQLNHGCLDHKNPAKIVVEKPFGYDYESAQKLNALLGTYFDEREIYRIDHFLGKETVQNILAFRFGNEIFEPVWNNKFVDNIQINFAEYKGIEKRGNYYDKTGALRDVVQNHLLQLLALITMDEPERFEQSSFRQKRLEILKSTRKLSPDEVSTQTVRGQYEGYLHEENVDKASQTETFCLIKLYIDTVRWQGVPIYVRTGKRLAGNVASIIVSFKEKEHTLFENFWDKPLPNHVTLQIQPNEGIGIRLVAKTPGLTTQLEPVDMEFCYKTSFESKQPDAYERLLIDIILGDQTLFLGQVGESWKIMDPIINVWQSGKPKLATYKPGTWGPKEADDLIKRDKRDWMAPILTICKI